ncbi:DUF342 domain-containing protein [Alkaliphilus sp. MSJ-5]|uniref:DUF342 domain-containing protein n=1 Tax=Alkaliphilus flagellatus TaxID=2841507 RepID=A0ABS6G746_9FIRM|nr:FapA family protein [Alkaliphilus flagellatus]MBU5677443.1 DUF342 domain-containing protein [Alkaliphilus flagellatus]
MTNEYIVVEGETYNDALTKGLKSLNLTDDQVKVEVLDEKKGFLFKKGLFKLKITPISISYDTDIQSDKNINDTKKSEFYLDYRPDGVYLTITEIPSKVGIGNILDFLTKKYVKDYDYEKIARCLENKNGDPEKIAPSQDEFLIDSSLQIDVSKNKLEVTILLTEPSGGKILSATEIVDNLNKNNIKFGIINKKIEEVVNRQVFNQSILIAQGKAAISGEDGQIIYPFNDETESRNTIIDEDGRIDYKNLNRIRNVNAGTLLIEIIPPTEGINGMDVYGNEIVAKNGKEVLIKKGKNVVESEDGLKIYAAKDGEVHFIDGTIYVDEVININGDIDNETGNIQFNGKINIKGNVQSGFKVEAEGDIEIWGVVEGATLISKGNIIIHRGVQGNNQAYLQCSGNLNAKYLENVRVKCGGNVVSDAILHSDVTTKGKIIVSGKKGLIVGGDIKAGKEVRANVVGSNMGTITRIEVGIDPEEKKYYEQLKVEMLDIEKNIDNSKKAIELLNKISKKQQLTNEKQELLVKSLKTYKVLNAKYDDVTKELQELSARFKEPNNGKIHVVTTIYTGVKVTIGSSSRQIYDELSNCTLYVKDGDVSIGPYEK